MIDYYLVYRFVKGLATPFNQWDAFKLGIIDENGKILKSRKDLKTTKEQEAFSLYDLLMLNIKKVLAKLPGGDTKLASYAAALYLLREQNMFLSNSVLTESDLFIDDNQIIHYVTEAVNQKMMEDTSVGGGNIAGLGVGPQGEPGFAKDVQKKWTKQNKRKTYSAFMSEQDTILSVGTREAAEGKKQRRNKKHPRETIPLA